MLCSPFLHFSFFLSVWQKPTLAYFLPPLAQTFHNFCIFAKNFRQNAKINSRKYVNTKIFVWSPLMPAVPAPGQSALFYMPSLWWAEIWGWGHAEDNLYNVHICTYFVDLPIWRTWSKIHQNHLEYKISRALTVVLFTCRSLRICKKEKEKIWWVKS